ncbi:hypothetical protein HHK36_028048 [Tetracentron sinense]|uniref:Dirigent protein n=1 Tax=Tetracentron sinense TaxID=13715 RepID=A0A835D235_TETSI|nr:hypothetical protein HHK36_028048 [Tetracentron sinense]
MVFYMHDYETGNNITTIAVAGNPKKKWGILEFGTVFAMDDPLTVAYDRNSTQIGRAHGIYVNSATDGSDLHFLMSLIFTNKDYNGSTLEIQGADRFLLKYREVSIVSGTRMFCFARGSTLALHHDSAASRSLPQFYDTCGKPVMRNCSHKSLVPLGVLSLMSCPLLKEPSQFGPESLLNLLIPFLLYELLCLLGSSKLTVMEPSSSMALSGVRNYEKDDKQISPLLNEGQCRPILGMDILAIESCKILVEGEKSDEIGTLSPQNENIDLGDNLTSNKAAKIVNAPYVEMHFDSIEEVNEYFEEYGRYNGFQFEFNRQTKNKDV